jgi:hypothetical protein
MRQHLACFLAVIAFALGCTTERTAIDALLLPEDPRWAPIDSLADKGQYASALSMTEPLLTEARTNGDYQQEFRAMMTKARFEQATGVEDTTIIGEFEMRAGTAGFPLNALLHSVIGEQYWSYYRDNRWEIMERTATQDDPSDMSTWSQPVFMRKVIDEYRASLVDADSLKRVPVGAILQLVIGRESDNGSPYSPAELRRSIALRPTLFDLLAHRALDVFRNTETRVAEPASRFKLNDARYFSLFEDLASLRLPNADSTSWELQALKLHKELEHTHLNDATPDAMVDNALARLSFVRELSTLPDKDSLYLGALVTLASRLPNDSCLSDVLVAQTHWHQEMGGKYQRLTDGQTANAPWKWELKQALTLCDTVLARYPGSFAAATATSIRASLLDAQLTVNVEEGVLPDAPFKAAITYRNVTKLWLQLVKDDAGIDEYLERSGNPDAEKLIGKKPLREWSIALPDDGDLNEHVTEVAVDGLPFGRYVLLVSDKSTFTAKVDDIAFAPFWVTRLAMTQRWKQGDLDLLVVDRGTGAPRMGVRVVPWVRNYRDGVGFKRSSEDLVTGTDGFIRSPSRSTEGNLGWELVDGEDRFISSLTWIPSDRNEQQEEDTRIFLFTDRAIYRPGQPVMFKGIVTRKSGRSNTTVPGFKTTVEFFDVNGEKVDSLSVTSDAYGAFNGTFTAPQGTLTGSMSLQTPYGSQQIQVEEYKRPTFEVTFDPIAGQPKLGQEVSVTGLAKSYAGVPLDGAKVQWTAKRSAQMPWWCGWYYRGWLPWGRSTQVAQGEAECDAQGKFTVKFIAGPDDEFPRGAEPIFNFTVDASITDISGETQSNSTGLSLGYKSISIELGLGESLDRSKADSIDVHVANLNGQRVDVPMDIRVFKLQAPPTPLRERQWERPDRFTLTREEHAARFPQEVYTNENDPLTWTRGTEVMQERGYVAAARQFSMRDARAWEVGSYLIEVVAKDADGEEVKVTKHVTVFDPTIQNTGFVSDAFHAELLEPRVEPGAKAGLLLSSALPDGRVLMEVERAGRIAVSRWFILKNTQQLVELPVLEDDRGGFTVHLFCVERGLVHIESTFIDVPWSNKELKVEWMSFRDKLLPGSEEEWRLKITGPKGEKVAAQLLGAMYDASLDHFVPHAWDMGIWQNNYAQLGWQRQEPFGAAGGQVIWNGDRYRRYDYMTMPVHHYPELNNFGYDLADQRKYRRRFRGARDGALMDAAPGYEVAGAFAPADGDGIMALKVADATGVAEAENVSVPATGQPTTGQPTTDNQQPIRSDFRETAFFFPDLLTDRDGSIMLRFKTPDALTRWKVMGLAHTKDLQLAQFTRETVTQKPLMVVPNLPRFLRSGDRITLTAKINVLETGRAEGLASLELFDPYTNASLNKSFGLGVKDQPFVAAVGESAVVEWSITVPEGVDVCGVRITARSKGGPRSTIVASDGEERPLPVLTDKVLVTESVPLWSNKSGTRTFKLSNLLTAGNSTTLRHQSLKLEYTPNPAWYAVQALPYLMEFPHECAEQVFSRYYANRLAAHIVEQRPAIKKVFEQWKQAGPEAFASKLEKNPELKNILLAESPWVVNARSEREGKERIALLFDLQRMGTEEASALKKLRDMQLSNGAWPWWSGMSESRWITQHIVAGLGHLEQLKATGRGDGQTQDMLKRAVNWLDQDAVTDYNRTVKHMSKEELEKYHPGYTELHYLYARTLFPRWPIDGEAGAVAHFYQEHAAKNWLSYGLQEQAMLALALHRLGDHTTPALIMESLKQRATSSEELGMYWKDFTSGMDWNSFPTETHALMIEAFDVVAKDDASVNALRTYLLKLKQTTDWKTTKATAEACYALLLTGDAWLDDAQAPAIVVGNETIKADKKEAGTGAIEQTWSAAEIRPAMGSVTITSKADKPSWGALHWQYFESMDKVKPHESPFSIRKQVMLTKQGDKGPTLIALDGKQKLKAGDKLTIRIELRTDRYVDYVHMKDLRASGLEPTETLSGYKYQGGLGYYQSIRDASTNFFFDRIAPGTYVFEYALRVTHAGEFSNGITTAMCMYAPEFSSHSEGVRLKVEE